MQRDMKKFLTNPFAVVWAIMAIVALVCAIGWGAYWHYWTFAMSAVMAWVCYKYD